MMGYYVMPKYAFDLEIFFNTHPTSYQPKVIFEVII